MTHRRSMESHPSGRSTSDSGSPPMTKAFVILGDPIAQARSPGVFNRLFRKRRVDAVMTPMLVSAEYFEKALSDLRTVDNMAGLVITVPHKVAAARLMKMGSRRATLAMAANALRPARTDGKAISSTEKGLCAAWWKGEPSQAHAAHSSVVEARARRFPSPFSKRA